MNDRIYAGHHVRPLVEVEASGGVIDSYDGNGTATLQGENPVQLPARSELSNGLPRRQIVIDRGSEAVPGIKAGRPVLRAKIARILWEGHSGCEVDSVRGIVQ